MSFPAVVSPIQWSSRLLFRSVNSTPSTPTPSTSTPLSATISSPPSDSHLNLNTSPNSSINNYNYSSTKFSDKILLPPSVLQSLIDQSSTTHSLPSPLTFCITNPLTKQFTHVGIREFSADEGTAIIPSVIASRIGLKEQQPVYIQLVELPKASFLSLSVSDPSSEDISENTLNGSNNNASYTEVDDWKALLEAQLQSAYTVLTKGDTLYINDPANPSRHFKCLVSELKPADAVLIVDTDIDLDIVHENNTNNELGGSSSKGKFASKSNSNSKSTLSKSNFSSEPLVIDFSKNPATKATTVTIPQISSEELPNQKFVIKSWNKNFPLTISISNLKNEKNTDSPNHDITSDPNFLNMFVSPSQFAYSSSAFTWSTLLTTNQREKTLSIKPTDPYLPSSLPPINSSSDNGDNHSDNQDSHLYAVLSIPQNTPTKFSYHDVIVSFSQDISSSSSSDDDDGDASMTDAHPDTKQCQNCQNFVPARSYQLHLTFCERNNIRCPKGCNQLFLRKDGGIPKSHWHCEECQEHNNNNNSSLSSIFGNTEQSHQFHIQKVHTPVHCDACEQTESLFSNTIDLALHKTTTCPAKLHICQFCHLKLPQGVASPVDILEGYTGHESFCGSKTTDCPTCKKAVRLRDLSAHMMIHNFQRLSNKPPSNICSNINCLRVLENESPQTKPPYGLCAMCYGPLHNSTHDPTGNRIKQRVERRYVIQLTRGCGKPFCTNYETCATAMGLKLKMPEVMAKVKELMEMKEDNDESFLNSTTTTKNDPVNQRFKTVKFCVDETTLKRKMFVDLISEIEHLYSKEWAAKAIHLAKGNEAEARKWLETNAVKISEQ